MYLPICPTEENNTELKPHRQANKIWPDQINLNQTTHDQTKLNSSEEDRIWYPLDERLGEP